MELVNIQRELKKAIQRTAKKVAETPAVNWTLGSIDSRLELLEVYWQDFNHNHGQLLTLGEESTRDYVSGDLYPLVEELYVESRGTLLDHRARCVAANDQASTPAASSEATAHGADFLISKLPRLELPTFSGKPEDWEAFRDLFVDLVHDNATLGDATKINYLKTNVKGSDEEALREFRSVAGNYKQAWEALCRRFDQPKLQVGDHLAKLVGLNPIAEETPEGLQTLMDELSRCRTQLEHPGRPVQTWDDWFVFMGVRALDPVTKRAWEEEPEPSMSTDSVSMPGETSFSQFTEFLQRRYCTLRAIIQATTSTATDFSSSRKRTAQPSGPRTIRAHATGTHRERGGCPACKEAHYIGHCLIFRGLEPEERSKLVSARGLCYNCLSHSHTARNCPSNNTCRSCAGAHHTLIREGADKAHRHTDEEPQPKRPHDDQSATLQAAVTRPKPVGDDRPERVAVLRMAMVALSNGGDREEAARALLDPCSEATIISLDFAHRLGCQLRRTNVGVTGVTGPAMDSAKHQAAIYIVNAAHRSPIRANAYVLRTLSIITPSGVPRLEGSNIRRRLLLADPTFDQPGRIDVVIGADVYNLIILAGTRRIGSLLTQNTAFGWPVMGSASTSESATTPSHTRVLTMEFQPCDDLSHEKPLSLVQRFWALEEVPVTRRVSTVDLECEAIFAREVRRTIEGRYIVRLPLRPEKVALLGDSLPQARSALASMQRQMRSDSALLEGYCRFMEEYEQLGHMRPLTAEEIASGSATAYYVPHHGIWQHSDGGTKLRVVFNASRATSTGLSLNDALHSGPKLQGHIATIITRWRRDRYIFCAHVQHMFRQILVDERDVHWQRIVWSPSPKILARHFALLTVTYGTACAPYLALRTMQQLGEDEGERFPLARDLLRSDLYMDDFLSGSHELETAKHLRDQLIGLLRVGGFHLRKWVANEPSLLEDIPVEDRLRPDWVQLSTDGPVRELGIIWDPVTDRFKFRPGAIDPPSRLTKRTALAELAGIFDPAGWLTPLTLVAKIVIQDLWRAKYDWDKELPSSWLDRWLAFRARIQEAANLSIVWWFGNVPGEGLQLHAFADASRRALAAVVYARATNSAGEVTSTIIVAKSKLASVKSLLRTTEGQARMTIPRLELRAMLIASQLLKDVVNALSVPLSNCHLWSDSQVVLHWLRTDEPVGHDLIDNYVSHVQELSLGVALHHVPTSCNPTDVASRGTDTAKLTPHPLWWTGPDWLSRPVDEWPREIGEENGPMHPSGGTVTCAATRSGGGSPSSGRTHIELFSTLGALLRGTARAVRVLRRRGGVQLLSPTTAEDLRHAFIVCSRIVQCSAFADELFQLSQGGSLKGCSKIKSLEPFLDADGVIRVGGRLDRSRLPYDERHPILLPGTSHLALLVIRWAH